MSKCSIDFNDAVIWQNKVWFFSNDFNGLYSVDLLNQEVEFQGRVPFEPLLGECLYSSLVIWENKIYLIPFKAKRMAIYDVSTGEFGQMNLNTEKQQYFNGTCLYGNYLFLFHYLDTTILKIDLKSEIITVIDEWIDKASPYFFEKSNVSHFTKQLVCKEGKIYMPFMCANAVLEIDCENSHSNIHVMGTAEQGYAGICEDGEDLWMAPKRRNGAVIRWNPKTNHKDMFQCKDDSNSFGYIGIAKEHGKICLYHFYKLPQFSHNPSFKVKPNQCKFVKVSDQYVLALDINKNVLIIYDKTTDEEKEIVIFVEYDNTPLIHGFKEKIVMESQAQSVSRLFDAIDLEKKDPKELETKVGKNIYQVISSMEDEY